MRNQHATRGYALITMVILMSMVLVYLAIQWRITSYSYELAIKKCDYYCRYAAATTLLKYGIVFAQHRYDTLRKKHTDDPFCIPIKQMPLPTLSASHIQCIPAHGAVIVAASCTGLQHESCRMSCHLVKHISKQDTSQYSFSLEHWCD